MRNKPKLKPSFASKLSKSETEAFLYQNLTIDEDCDAEDNSTSEESIEKHTSTLVNWAIAKNDNLDDLRNLSSTECEKSLALNLK